MTRRNVYSPGKKLGFGEGPRGDGEQQDDEDEETPENGFIAMSTALFEKASVITASTIVNLTKVSSHAL